jgi:plastocyanin
VLAAAVYFLLASDTNQSGAKTIISMTDEGYSPSTVTIKQGETIVFENNSSMDNWPASNIHPTHEIYSEFDPKRPIASGDSWSFTFDQAGIWRFHDHLTPSFVGTITVE